MILDNLSKFIAARVREHPQIAEWLGDWSPEFETQVNINTDGLEPAHFDLKSKPTKWLTPEGSLIGHIRIPHNAYTDRPTFGDRRAHGNEHKYWQYIGTTGWNWRRCRSHWVGFDFDSIANHKGGLTAEQLEEILNRARALPYVVARTSKSTKGIHLIVRLDPQPATKTHTEHSALARYVLNRMSDECNFPFHSGIDCCGSVLWHWAKGLTSDGLKRI